MADCPNCQWMDFTLRTYRDYSHNGGIINLIFTWYTLCRVMIRPINSKVRRRSSPLQVNQDEYLLPPSKVPRVYTLWSPHQRLSTLSLLDLFGSSQDIEAKAKCLCYESQVRFTFRYNNLHDMTNSITEISEVRVQLLEWRVTLHLNVWQYMYRCGETVANATLSPSTW